MNKDEALKMAIEFAQRGGSISVPQYYLERDKVIKACKEALKPHPNCDEACMFQCEMEKENNQWQGLTDEERYLNEGRTSEEIEYARAIEAKLKEKNTL